MILAYFIAVTVCLIAAFTDFKYRKIYNWLVVITIASAAVIHRLNILHTLAPAVTLFLFMVFVAFLLRDTSMGGDVKFLSSLALLLGNDIYPAVLVSCIVFIVAGAVIYLRQNKGFDAGFLKLKLPLGMFLPAGVLAVLIVRLLTKTI
ncbi:prepilin peptidase [Caldicellulosiruptor acetigenus]|uniref:prepilin peptidase n=1 Tax=Caldicellulosiruptor acetigenus TaxID=301953 RepID=UPI0022A94C57|nr:prepilin peptidase [Caldicellulosiruptor acetigenus]WAM36603.1 prepilin peptidase [Caldicellulosiruptor acetigenus]